MTLRYSRLIEPTGAVHSENVLCQIDANGYDSHYFPSYVGAKRLASPSWHVVAVNRKSHDTRLGRDLEVPFVR